MARASRWVAPLVTVGLLLSAFAPVTVTLSLVAGPFGVWWANVLLAIVFAAPVLLLPAVLRAARRLGTRRIAAQEVRRRDGDNLSLMSSFILPISVAVLAPEGARTVASVVLLVLLGVIYVRGGLQHLNPLLIVFGYHVYAIEQTNGVEVFVLSRAEHIAQDAVVDAYPFSDSVLIDEGAR